MMKTVFKRAVTLAICAVTVFCGIFACSGATKDYEIPQIDDMTLSMPDGMSAVTRDSKSTDKYFSVFGLDYDTKPFRTEISIFRVWIICHRLF